MAALFKLPCVFVCENNGYGEYTAQANHQAIIDVADRASGYGMPGVIVDGMDVVAVYEAAGEAIQRARDGAGPTLVGVRGMGLTYRTDEELAEWRKKDAIDSFERRLIQLGVMSQKKIDAVRTKIDKEIVEAIKFAEDSPYPDPEDLLDNVYCVKEA